MPYTHLTTNELVMIEACYQEGATVSAIVASLGRSKQNGLLRRHGLPKQMDFRDLSQNVLSAIADKRNRIPRKSLNYQTPYQVFLSNI